MKKSYTYLLPIVIGVLGIILFSAKAIMVKLAYKYEVSAVSLLLFRMVFALPFYIVVLLFSKEKKRSIKKPEYMGLLLLGFTGYYLASYFDFLGLQYIKASIERIILFTYPTIVLILSAIFLKRKITKAKLIAVVLTYIGIFICFKDEVAIEGSTFLWGGFLIFLSAFMYATYLTGSDWLISRLGVIRFTSYAMIIACVAVVLHYSIFERTTLIGYHKNVYLLGFLMAILSTVIPSYLISFCIKKIGASNFAILAGIGPISTIVLANIVLNEQLTILQLLGSLVVIIGILIISLKKERS